MKPRPSWHLYAFVMDRVRSFGLVVAIGFLLLVSIVVTTGLFALLFRFLPDVRLR